MKNKNTIWIIGGVALAFVLLNSFTTIPKKKEEKKPSGGGAGVPQPQNVPQLQEQSQGNPQVQDEVLTKEKLSAPKKDLMPCPEGFNKVSRGGVAGDIFFFCEPKGARVSIMDK